ncbi:hypothetical protein M2322_002141 [Rhodoblastus acidophilus]|uniref:hypothetical protein n=1 Tax=Rhodoblastus acidophilus TaxID=1074 RepID=UPI0022250144|nr:hypothetical protein [Rhodoblastus acidophilus]MCW2316593.1 hypothetical protein [Rhodoblastus acidophilus]
MSSNFMTRFFRLSRREFLRGYLGAYLCLFAGATKASSRPLKIYYNDDATDLQMASPFHELHQDVTDTELAANMRQCFEAGVDVYVLQPGTGWVPLWRSDVYPADEHYRWFNRTYNVQPFGLIKYMMNGGDLVAAALREARAYGRKLIVSFRLNDIHTIEFSGRSPDYARAHMHDANIPEWLQSLPYHISRVHMEHPEWRFEPESVNPEDLLWDWRHPAAVAHKLALVSELATKYDIDGIELDFMRFPRFFGDDFALVERFQIIGNFIRAVRDALDAGRKGRELTLRVPPKVAALAALGVDLSQAKEIGVTRINVSSHTFTNQDVDFEEFRAAGHGMALSLELAYAKHFLMHQQSRRPNDDMTIHSAPIDDVSTAWLARSQGFDSVSIFNFFYYRDYREGKKNYDSSHEPPFFVIEKLKEPERWLNPIQCWSLGSVFTQGFKQYAQMPAQVAVGRSAALRLLIVLPESMRILEGCLRYVAREKRAVNSSGAFRVSMNGVVLTEDGDARLGDMLPEDPGLPFRTLKVPLYAVRSGWNMVVIEQLSGGLSEIPLVELLTIVL